MTCLVRYLVSQMPVIQRQSTSQAVQLGESVRLGIVASGYPSVQFAWAHDGREIRGEVTNVLSFASFSEADFGTYVCKVHNIAGYDACMRTHYYCRNSSVVLIIK